MNLMLSDYQREMARSEPGQAFDKLARALESRMHEVTPSAGSREQWQKARALFVAAVDREDVWQSLSENAHGIEQFFEELTSYLQAEHEARTELRSHADELRSAVSRGKHEDAAVALARLFLTLRNKRFHGHAEFNGQNFRINRSVQAFYAVLAQIARQ